jgi:tetratricopeptide (TPR) repeat protein
MLFFLDGDYAGADAGFEMALRGFADYPPALVGRAQVALAEERYRDAIPLLEAAYRKSPLAETAWLLGDARRKAGDLEGAAAAYQELVHKGRRTDRRTVALYLATENRDLDEAAALIERERRGRNDLYTQDVYALVLLRKGRGAEARAVIDAVLQVGVRDPRILHHAALIHAATDDKQGARRLVEDALRTSPRFDVSGAESARALLASLGGSVAPTPLAAR